MALERRNYKMLLCFTEYNQEREQDFIQMVRQNRADGIIALTYNPHLEIPDDIPFVTIDRFFSVSVPCVASDNFAGGRMAACELAKRGCKRVAFMRIGSLLTNEPNKRKDGFISGCMEFGLSYECLLLNDGMPASGFEAALIRSPTRSSACCVPWDCGCRRMSRSSVLMAFECSATWITSVPPSNSP